MAGKRGVLKMQSPLMLLITKWFYSPQIRREESKEQDKIQARKGKSHSQGKQLSNIYSIDIYYKVEC